MLHEFTTVAEGIHFPNGTNIKENQIGNGHKGN